MKNVTKINQVDFSIFKKIRVAAYCRVSTDSDEQELSLETQKIIMRVTSKQTVNGNMQVFIMMMVSAVQRL